MLQGYSQLLLDHQRQVEHHLCAPHATLLMVMPPTVDLQHLPNADLVCTQRQKLTQDMGIGYARMCIQVVAYLIGMRSIWMLDDNISDCWTLPFEDFVQSESHSHSQLLPAKFNDVMTSIERQVGTVAGSYYWSLQVYASPL